MPNSSSNYHNLKNYLFLIFSVVLIYFWTNNEILSAYGLQLTAILIIFYFFVRFLLSRKNAVQYILDIIIFNAILLLALSATGGLASPLFFLIYFLIFACAMLFEIPFTLTLTLTLILFFANTLISLTSVLQLVSLLFFSPLAIFFGKQYLKLLQSQQVVKILSKQQKKMENTIKTEETGSLLWLNLNFKNGLITIIDKSSNLLTEIGRLNQNQKENLLSINQAAKDLLKSGEILEEKIDKETD